MEVGGLWDRKELLAPLLLKRVPLVQAYEPHLGMVVRVNDRPWRSEFRGLVGTVEHRWGSPEYPALDVRLDDGRLVLFWFHELDKAS